MVERGKGPTRHAYTQHGAPGFMALGPAVEVLTWPLVDRWTAANGKTGSSDFVVGCVWQRLPQGGRIAYGHES